jgi:glycosyltransferase involved in cell wall biosynthesis
MRIGFHYHTPAQFVDGKIRMPAYLGLFIDSIAAKTESVVCFQHSPLSHESALMDYAIGSSNVQFVNIGPHTSIPKRTLFAYQNRSLYSKWQDKLDVMLVRAATPLLPVIASAWKKPLVLFLVSDASEGIENLPQPGWRKKLISIWAGWYQHQQLNVARNTLTLVNSRRLYDQLRPTVRHLEEVRTTTLKETDLFIRSDTCLSSPYRLLYTGRMSRIKGLFEIVETLANLVGLGYDPVLDLVGMPDKGEAVLDELFVFADSLNIGDRVKYHGYKTAGSGLLAFYRQADVFITASQASSEGFPRTIWEAMASSLPVVATSVGSIPAFASEAALLVPPRDIRGLTSAVKDLFDHSHLRKKLICRGLAIARENTLDNRADQMLTYIDQWLTSTINSGKQDKVRLL